MTAPRTTCQECGAELWGADEADGVCGACKPQDGRDDDFDVSLDELEDAYVDEDGGGPW